MRRRAFTVAVPLAAAALLTVAVVDLRAPVPGNDVVVGVSAAEAAVTELRDALRRGILVRESVSYATVGVDSGEVRQRDWTNLASRDQRVQIRGDRVDMEYWNPSAHERFTRSNAWQSPDGRTVIEHWKDQGAANGSASASPIEELDQLLAQAKRGELSLRRRGGKLVLELTQRCLEDAAKGYTECAAPGEARRKPTADLKPITSFQTWWLADGDEPRILRHENGSIAAGTTKRRVDFRQRFERWEVLPETSANVELVAPPAFPEDRFLVITGRGGSMGDAMRAGKVICNRAALPPDVGC